MYLSGHLHRDPSLGNVLLAPVEETKPFEIPEKFLTHVSSLKDEKAAEEIKELCGKVEKLVGKLDLPIESHAVIGDGDLAVPWETYWTKDRRVSKSVSDFQSGWNAWFDGIYRVHLSLCPGPS